MKKLYPLLLAALAAGCQEKEIDEMSEDWTLYPVKFEVSGFTHEMEDFGTSRRNEATTDETNAVLTYLDYLRYFVYDESGELQAYGRQRREGKDPSLGFYYGGIHFELPLGTYRMVTVGWKGDLAFDFVLGGLVLPDRSGNFGISPTVYILGSRFNEVATRDFPGLIVHPNKRLILTGSLTGTHTTQSFYVSADSTWGEAEIVEFEGTGEE